MWVHKLMTKGATVGILKARVQLESDDPLEDVDKSILLRKENGMDTSLRQAQSHPALDIIWRAPSVSSPGQTMLHCAKYQKEKSCHIISTSGRQYLQQGWGDTPWQTTTRDKHENIICKLRQPIDACLGAASVFRVPSRV